MTYIIEFPGNDYPSTLRECDERDGVYRRSANVRGLQRLDYIRQCDMDTSAVVRQMLHHSGDPFIDAMFPPKPAYHITPAEAKRITELNLFRENRAREQYLRSVAACGEAVDTHPGLPPDEHASLERCAIP
jgi:hypothetical protein